MQDEEDEHIYCFINFFYIYQKISSKDEEIFLEDCEMSVLK
jgi:hypothetical protein